MTDKETSVKFIRMNTGEDLIGEVTFVKTSTSEYYCVSHPMKVMYMVGNRPNSFLVSLVEWVFPRMVEKQEFNINPSDVILIANSSASMEDYYWGVLERIESEEKVTRAEEERLSRMSDEEYEREAMPTEDSEKFTPEEQTAALEQLMEIFSPTKKRVLH